MLPPSTVTCTTPHSLAYAAVGHRYRHRLNAPDDPPGKPAWTSASPSRPDHYLKIWALTRPEIPADFLLLDEAQDTNPVVEQVFTAQRDHAQLVMVGDSAQAIYHWRGARDVMTGFDGTALVLSRSFRFGPALAQEANRWLAIADAPIRLTVTDTVCPGLGPCPEPDAVLCRTDMGAMTGVLHLLDVGHSTALVGGGGQLRALALAVQDLKEGRRTTHPELVLFPTWGAVQDYAASDPAGGDLQPLVDLVDRHGAQVILTAVDQLADETQAHVTVSTAHKAKGREWQASASPPTSPRPKRPTNTTRTAGPYRPPSTTPKPASPTSPSPALATTWTAAASPGSTSTPRDQKEQRTPRRSKDERPGSLSRTGFVWGYRPDSTPK
ncbi:UvrD/REP helicase N-terminal domain-containing protein [Streptomyces sp. DvalAA-14]|nr:UvrD/REP helicase N-terminal domain-containing protein [Streptomyces sp. DvalAA-14]